ncbi:hypothetical protein KIW84_011430 [Lathyrus oleraceus]|uniref:Transposase MuDR plant domain-containing protein n=1 Tax=Pisum sativum TaxID=3888 RepID=A0A9D5GUX5_PEA|nr:hypothetical protein KIW84_011430 [Pisum sativum]
MKFGPNKDLFFIEDEAQRHHLSFQCLSFDAYVCATQVNGDIYLGHDVSDIKLEVRVPRCINGITYMEGLDDEGVKGRPQKKFEDDYYLGGELDNSDPDESDDDEGSKFEMFRKDKLNKDYKFKWGMEFNSLADFRDTIYEWLVLNGKEITFVKKESYRVRVECKDKCDFLVLCSKVGRKHTYSIKTLVDTHTCVRVLNNRSLNSNWVAKTVVKKKKTSEIVRICDIMQDMRQIFSVGISVSRAWKEKLIANKIIEGDADKQYGNLWRYVVELTRFNIGNIGLVTVFEEMFERIEHRLYPRHLYANFKKRFRGGTLIRDLMMGDAKEIYYQGWLQKMNKLKQLDVKAWNWLMGVPTKFAKHKATLTICEWIRKYLMNRLVTPATKLEKWQNRVMPMPRKRLDKEVFDMWPEVQADEIQPPVYKNGLGRPRKVRIRECGEDGSMRRRLGWKPKASQAGVELMKNKANASHVQADASNVQIDASHVQVDVGNIQDDASHVDADVVAPSQEESSVVQESQVDSNVVKTSQTEPKQKKIKKPFLNLRKRKSERLELKMLQKPIIGPWSNYDQPITLTEMVTDVELGRGSDVELGENGTSSNPNLVNDEEGVSFGTEFDDDTQDTNEDDGHDIGGDDFIGAFDV